MYNMVDKMVVDANGVMGAHNDNFVDKENLFEFAINNIIYFQNAEYLWLENLI